MVTLLTIQNDPKGKLLKPLHNVLPLLTDLFREWYIVVTDDTHGDYMLLPWRVRFLKAKGMAQARRDVVAYALEDKPDDFYFYCDFDKLIVWASKYPDELQELITDFPQYDYTIMGRKVLAFNTYPPFQYGTERVMNSVMKEIYDLDMDFFAGARGMSRQALEWIGEWSEAQHAAQDIECPLIVQGNGGSLRYKMVRGLEYESEILGIKRSKENETKLRVLNLTSVLEFINDWNG